DSTAAAPSVAACVAAREGPALQRCRAPRARRSTSGRHGHRRILGSELTLRPSARPTRTKRPRLARLLGIFALVYAVICVGMFVAQRSLQYFPNRSPMDPAAAGLPAAQALSLQTADGERLAAWWIAP